MVICFDTELFCFNKLSCCCQAVDIQTNTLYCCCQNTGPAWDRASLPLKQKSHMQEVACSGTRRCSRRVPIQLLHEVFPGDSSVVPISLQPLEARNQQKDERSKGVSACANNTGKGPPRVSDPLNSLCHHKAPAWKTCSKVNSSESKQIIT